MRPFSYQAASDIGQAVQIGSAAPDTYYLAGGTTMVDLAKLEVMQPAKLVDINALQDRFGQDQRRCFRAEAWRVGAHVGWPKPMKP